MLDKIKGMNDKANQRLKEVSMTEETEKKEAETEEEKPAEKEEEKEKPAEETSEEKPAE